MKKYLCISLLILVMIFMTACGKKPAPVHPTKASTSQETTTSVPATSTGGTSSSTGSTSVGDETQSSSAGNSSSSSKGTKAQSTGNSSSSSKTPSTGTGSSSAPINRAEMKNLLANNGATFDSMKTSYGLQIEEQTKNNITATSTKMPD